LRSKIVFCACRSYKEDDSQNHFVCSNDKSNTGSCKIYFIKEPLLQQDTAARKAELIQPRKTLADAHKRIADLDTRVQKVYEDNALGKLPDTRILPC